MAPKAYTVPKVWKQPYTRIYNDNYRFGNSLYSGAVADLDRKNAESMAFRPYGTDLADIAFPSFGDTHLNSFGPHGLRPLAFRTSPRFFY